MTTGPPVWQFLPAFLTFDQPICRQSQAKTNKHEKRANETENWNTMCMYIYIYIQNQPRLVSSWSPIPQPKQPTHEPTKPTHQPCFMHSGATSEHRLRARSAMSRAAKVSALAARRSEGRHQQWLWWTHGWLWFIMVSNGGQLMVNWSTYG